MSSKEERSCSSGKINLGMETLTKDSNEDRQSTRRLPTLSEDPISCDGRIHCNPVTSPKVGNPTSTRRGTKRNFGEVNQSEAGDSDNSNKSSKIDSALRCSNVGTNPNFSEVENKSQSAGTVDETASGPSDSAIIDTFGDSDSTSSSDTCVDHFAIKTITPSASNGIIDTNGTNNKSMRTNSPINKHNTSDNKGTSNSSGSELSGSSTDGTITASNNNVNSAKRFSDSTIPETSNSTSNTGNDTYARVCNDISNTSAASNCSDTRSMSTTRSAALTLVTSSVSCTQISTCSRDTNSTCNNRASSDTNNNNRSTVNNNSDNRDSSESQSAGTVRSPALTSGRKVYGLRPRSSVRRLWSTDRPGQEDESTEPPSNCSTPTDQKPAGAKSTHAASSKSKPSGSSKSRGSRTKPLSKYRRITANARERERMKEINTAFAALRAALPTITDYRITSMTKYTTLQLASSYIRDLSRLLDETPSSDSENKKENCPSYLHGAINSNNRRDVNLSVGISELSSFERSQQIGSESKPGEFGVFPNAVNSLNNITEEQLEGLGDIENLSDMCWALDFMLD